MMRFLIFLVVIGGLGYAGFHYFIKQGESGAASIPKRLSAQVIQADSYNTLIISSPAKGRFTFTILGLLPAHKPEARDQLLSEWNIHGTRNTPFVFQVVRQKGERHLEGYVFMQNRTAKGGLQDMGMSMVASGLALWDKDSFPDYEGMADAQYSAQVARIGTWQ